MFLLNSVRPARLHRIAMIAVAAALVAAHAAIAQDSPAPLKFKPEQHNFGKITVTHASAPLTVTVTNKSSASVSFTSVVASENFAIETDKCSGAALAPGASCRVEVVFKPTEIAPIDDPSALIFTDSAQDSPQRIELDGQGIFGSLT
jgi:secreted trypsin-like serine protease